MMDQEHELELERRLTETEQRSKSNAHRLEQLEKNTEAINRMTISLERMAMKQDTMSESMSKLTLDVESIKAEPGKRWKFVVEKCIYFLVAAVAGFILARVGL